MVETVAQRSREEEWKLASGLYHHSSLGDIWGNRDPDLQQSHSELASLPFTLSLCVTAVTTNLQLITRSFPLSQCSTFLFLSVGKDSISLFYKKNAIYFSMSSSSATSLNKHFLYLHLTAYDLLSCEFFKSVVSSF